MQAACILQHLLATSSSCSKLTHFFKDQFSQKMFIFYPLLPSVPFMARLAKTLTSILEGIIIKKFLQASRL